ncbi:MAG: hypothetical protein H5T99_02515 [Moorella sp. (in: Bacteria)]|nr:hypothetical protein [Moorella sp. (in: firmicutes)]
MYTTNLAGTGRAPSRSEARRKSLDGILRLRSEIVRRTGVQEDSTAQVRKLREGQARHE